jgi:adenylate cyclase
MSGLGSQHDIDPHAELLGGDHGGGGRVRITVQLINGQSGAQLWTHGFDETLEDVFALQDKVALTVAGVIEPTLETHEVRRAAAL